MDFVDRLGIAIGVNNATKALVSRQIGSNEGHEKRKRTDPDADKETFLTLLRLNPGVYKQLYKRFWESVAGELMTHQTKMQTPTAKAKTNPYPIFWLISSLLPNACVLGVSEKKRMVSCVIRRLCW